jgi:hypothetical protein
MSEVTFNIADYRPLFAVRTHEHPGRSTAAKRPSGFVVLSNSELGERDGRWMDSSPAVFDIRTFREAERPHSGSSHSRRGKILRFTTEPHCRVYVMNATNPAAGEDDPDPSGEPPAA